jgi:hypothetical protein
VNRGRAGDEPVFVSISEKGFIRHVDVTANHPLFIT